MIHRVGDAAAVHGAQRRHRALDDAGIGPLLDGTAEIGCIEPQQDRRATDALHVDPLRPLPFGAGDMPEPVGVGPERLRESQIALIEHPDTEPIDRRRLRGG